MDPGLKDLYQLLFIHMKTRRVRLSPTTLNPDAEWVSQQAMEFLKHTQNVELQTGIVMRDKAGKFQKGFDEVLQQAGCVMKRNTPEFLNLNAFVERAIRTYQQECLAHFVVAHPCQLKVIGKEFQAWYHDERPHSAVNSLPPGDQTILQTPPEQPGQEIICTTRLDGLLKHHRRRAV